MESPATTPSSVPRAPDRKLFQFNLEGTADPVLVQLARSDHREAKRAKDVLFARHYERMLQVAAARARKYRASREDREDARQHAYIGFAEAVQKFNPVVAEATDCSFATFLAQVVDRRIQDWLLSNWRVEKHQNRLVPLIDERGEPSPAICKIHFGPDGRPVTDGPVTDPARVAEDRELRARLDAAVAGLKGMLRRMYDALVAGVPLLELARELNLSYDKAKRMRRGLIKRLSKQAGVAIG